MAPPAGSGTEPDITGSAARCAYATCAAGVVLAPAVELPRPQAHTGVAKPQLGLGLSVEHSVADGPGYGDPAVQRLTAGLVPVHARQDVLVSIGVVMLFNRRKKACIGRASNFLYGAITHDRN